MKLNLSLPRRYVGTVRSPSSFARSLRYHGYRGFPPQEQGEYCRVRLMHATAIIQANGDVWFEGDLSSDLPVVTPYLDTQTGVGG